jgi:hypothetical protein
MEMPDCGVESLHRGSYFVTRTVTIENEGAALYVALKLICEYRGINSPY